MTYSGSSIISQSNLAAANTAFSTALQEATGARPPGKYQFFTTEEDARGSTRLELPFVDLTGTVRAFEGARRINNARAYRLQVDTKAWEDTKQIPVDQINGDTQGVLGMRLAQWVAQTSQMYDKIVFDSLVANPTGYDGQALLSASHPNVGGSGSSDNLEAASLTFALFATADQGISERKDEAGEPLDYSATHLLVGTAQREFAMLVTGAVRPVGVTPPGEINAATGAGAVTLEHGIAQGVQVIESSRITGNEWFLMDLSKPNRLPMGLAIFSDLDASILDDPKDPNVLYDRTVIYALSFSATPFANDWRAVHGSVTA